jgi:dTDP-4-dehydrorhamnose 3,5-epimerase
MGAHCSRPEDSGKWQSFVLSDKNRQQVLVPPGYGNAHLVLSDTAIFHYKQSTYYEPSKQFTYRWDEPRFGIWWPIKNPVLSQRDE